MSQRAGRHWVIAGVGLLILLVTNGLTATAITVFDESLLEEFGWSRSDLKFRDFINFTVVALFAPAAGWVLDKVGVRRMLVTGCLILSAAYFAYSRLTGLQQMYAIHVAFAFSLLSAGTMVVIVLVSSWFIERRGLAIGIALIGTSAGSFLLPPLNAELIARLGWRDTFALEAAFPLVLLGVILLLVRNSPVDEGLTP
ncbi:MAG: MFS transporter, partial [Steroidobacteraceae bacterium]